MTTSPNTQQDQAEPTPPEAEQTGTTQPQAENQGTTPPDSGNAGNQAQVDIDKIVTKRLERERKKWEAEAEEAARLAKMDEAQRAKAELEKAQRQIEEAKAEARRERSMRQIAGKVVDEEDALTIAERLNLVAEDGTVDLDALLKAKPYLAPTKATIGGPSRPPAEDDAGDLPTQIRKAEQAGDWDKAFRLKNQLYARQRVS